MSSTLHLLNRIYWFFILLLLMYQSAHAGELKNGFIKQLVAEKLDPTTMAIAPDGRVFVLEKKGLIRIIENDHKLEAPFITLEVDNFNERGLGGIALDPNFDYNGYVYLYYTPKSANFNRISRFTATGNTAMPGSEKVLLDLDLLSSGIHNGGGMVFGPDGKLYIATGDGGSAKQAQSLTSLLGKVLRINPDGSIPEDNPFYYQQEGKYRAIWALGLRNPFSMAFDPATAMILANDVGEANYEEINLIEKGKNYGWPLIEGPLGGRIPPENYQDPLFSYDHNTGCSIVGAAFYRAEINAFPNEYVGKFFYTDYCSGTLSVFDPAQGIPMSILATGLDRPVSFAVGPRGDLYYLERSGLRDGSYVDNTSTADGSLWKITYTGSDFPFVSRNPLAVKVPVNENARFEVVASGGQPLSFEWSVNNVVIPDNNTPVLILQDVNIDLNNAAIECKITNSYGSVVTEPVSLSVTKNTRPVPQILSPNSDYRYKGGSVINFEGSATDLEDGELDPEMLKWEIRFHHDQHTHPALAPQSGSYHGSYSVPQVGETSTNVWYRIHLTATDSEGLSQTVYKDIFPEIAKVIIDTSPYKFPVNVDGKVVDTPYTFNAVVGTTRTIESIAGFNKFKDNLYIFDKWGEQNESRILKFDVPPSSKYITAFYRKTSPGNGNGLLGKYYNSLEEFELDSPALVRVDTQIDFDWGMASPSNQVRADSFYVRWTGFIQPYNTGYYTVVLSSDDGVRLWINNQVVIDDWKNHPLEFNEASIYLEEGNLYPIQLEYFEATGAAVIKLAWKTDSFLTETVPHTQLFEEPLVSGIPAEYPLENRSRAFPNPFSSELNMDIRGHEGTIMFSVQDIHGRTIIKEQKLESNYNIASYNDIKSLSAGMYILMLRSSKKNELIRLIKAH